MKNAELTKIKKLIEEGQLEESLQIITSVEMPNYQKNRVLLQCARFRILQNHHDLSRRECELEENNIIESLLCIINSIERIEDIERSDITRNYNNAKGSEKISILENATFTGLAFAMLGFLLVITSHWGNENLRDGTFGAGIALLLISFMSFLYTRLFLAPTVISSYLKAETLSKDFQLLFTDLSKLLRSAHDYSALHMSHIETILDLFKSGDIKPRSDLAAVIDGLKNYSSLSGIFDDTMNIIEDIEFSIIKSEYTDLNQYSIDLEKNAMRIKQIVQNAI